MEHLTTRPTPDLEPDLLKFLNNNCGQHCEEITLTATSAGERITATKPTECISYVVGRVKIPLSGREQNWNKVNIIPHLNCLGKAISSLNRFKIGLPKDNNNRFSVKIVGMLAPQGALYTIVLGWTQLRLLLFSTAVSQYLQNDRCSQDLCGRLHGGRINGDTKWQPTGWIYRNLPPEGGDLQ